ncbi:MAG: sulfite exporter TauE/SafE family protein [Chloroflexi bacterium]|nr:sulfite exporter TauE/SafE family protein [Chloroflexota bacterium]
MEEILASIAIGLIAGFAAGMLGIGGGSIYVPTLVLLMNEPQHIAQGASLAAIVATALVGGLTHLRRGNVDLPTVAWVAPVAVVAAFGAALLADMLDPTVLRRIFAAVFIYFALTMIVGAVRGERVSESEGR